MEGAAGTRKPSHSSDSNPKTAGDGASKYLANLPSRGLFSSNVFSSNPVGAPAFADQLIKTNQTNILIRSLTLKKQKNDCSLKDLKAKITAECMKGKRAAERTTDGKTSSKRANLATGSEGPSLSPSKLQGLTVERLRSLLKERGLSTKGKKDELIARLKDDCDLTLRARKDHEGGEDDRST